jgi:hypothetical protein
LGGGSDQGILNPATEQSQWEINLGARPQASVLWMQCLGVDAVYVSDRNSQEMFKDTEHPEKYDNVLPVIYDDHAGNRIFRVPRRYPARVRVVETARLNAVQRPRANDDVERLQTYADVIENGPDAPGTLSREGTDVVHIKVTSSAGQSVVVQESYDAAWHAWSGGKALPIRKDAMGFMVIDAPTWSHEITLVFVTPLENQLGRVLTVLALLACLILGALSVRSRRAKVE